MAEELELSGYKSYTEVLAQRTEREGGRKTFIIALPLHLISKYVPIPDPDKPFPGNRRVNKRHAEKFGEYWRETKNWVAPPLLVDTILPLNSDFVEKFGVGGVDVGVLRLGYNSAEELAILDGQHRILGWKLVGERLSRELKNAYMNLEAARRDGHVDLESKILREIEEIRADQHRFETEFVTLEIMQGVSEEDHKQAFNDIATNARGITKSVTVSFDRRSMINRIAIDMSESVELLAGRVDWEKDRIAGANPNFISGKNLADIVRHVTLGIDGRMTNRREKELSEHGVSELVEAFFRVLVSSFPQLKQVEADAIAAMDLRGQDMVSSATVLRVLAGVFHNLAVDISDESRPKLDEAGVEKVAQLFSSLSSHTEFPVDPRWMDTGFFLENAKAPSSRAQDLRGLTNLITEWGDAGEIFLPSSEEN